MSGKKRKVGSTNDGITSTTTRKKNNVEDNDDSNRNEMIDNKNDKNNNVVNDNSNKTNNNDYDSNNNYIRQCILPKPLLISHDHNNKYLKIITWNVNGFTSLYNKNLNKLLNLFNVYQPDILCLQETKIQENLISNYQYLINDYVSYWNCSTVKKGIYYLLCYFTIHSKQYYSIYINNNNLY